VRSTNALKDDRREDRDEVHFRMRAFGGDAQPVTLLVVNLSPHGMMARVNEPHEAGERMRLMMPTGGSVAAEVRWSLGGRAGIQFDKVIDLASYYELLAVVLK
jgi:hypothetical protein